MSSATEIKSTHCNYWPRPTIQKTLLRSHVVGPVVLFFSHFSSYILPEITREFNSIHLYYYNTYYYVLCHLVEVTPRWTRGVHQTNMVSPDKR